MTSRLSHLFVHVLDLDEAVAFWSEVVGLEVLMTEPGYVRVGGGDGFEFGMEQREPAEVGAAGIELAVQVDDVHAAYERMRAAGVVFLAPPQAQPWGAVHAWFTDPNGYRCSIYSRDASG